MKEEIKWEAYSYDINLGANIAFAVLFGMQAIGCLVLMIMCYSKAKILGSNLRNRYTLMMLPFLLGLALECVGYIGRIINNSDQDDLGPYILQSTTLLVAPAFMAASLYMNFGEVLKIYNAQEYCLIPVKWLTKVFVFGDVISILIQGAGGGIQGGGGLDKFNTGKNIIIGGLFIQIFFFGAFVVNSTIFAFRFNKANRGTKLPHNKFSDRKSWKHLLSCLYLVCIAILVRSIFRIIEYLQGFRGELVSSEAYFFVLDSSIIFLGAVVYLIASISIQLTSLRIAYPSGVVETFSKDESSKGSSV